MRAHRPSSLKLGVAFACIYFIWGSTFLAIRYAVETIPPFTMAGTRFLSAGIILFAILRLRGEPLPERGHWRAAAITGAMLLMIGNGGVSWSEQRVPSALAALMIATIPMWMTLVEWLGHGGPKPSAAIVLGLAAGFAGTALLVNPGESGIAGHVDPRSALVLMISAASWASGSIWSRRAHLPRSPFMAAAMQLLCGGSFLLLLGAAVGEWGRLDPAAVTARSVISLAYLSLLGSVVTLSAYVWLLRVASAPAVATYAYVNPLVAVLLGWALGGETITGRTLAATAVIVAAVGVISWSRLRGSRPAAPRASLAPATTEAEGA